MTEPDVDADDAFERLIDAAIASLPEWVRAQLPSVAIVLEDEPSPDQLRSVGARGLFGLYQGVPRTSYGAENAAVPSKITLFRGPLQRAYGYAGDARLAAGIRDVVVHEIAHHLGIDDERITELQAR
jgi:predicted Zn-dependent protease with MMP-like domain